MQCIAIMHCISSIGRLLILWGLTKMKGLSLLPPLMFGWSRKKGVGDNVLGDYIEKYMNRNRIYIHIPENAEGYIYESRISAPIYESSNLHTYNNQVNSSIYNNENLMGESNYINKNSYIYSSENSGLNYSYNNAYAQEYNKYNNYNLYNSDESSSFLYTNNYSQTNKSSEVGYSFSEMKNVYSALNNNDYLYNFGDESSVSSKHFNSTSQTSEYISISDITEGALNNISDSVKNINISLGGITQNFAGGENVEDIADSLCAYLKNALNGMAEGVYI